MKKVGELGNIFSETAYQYWNMGNGMLIIMHESETEPFLRKIEDVGYEAKAAGRVVAEQRIRIL